jgi:hypothetical protein
MHPRYIYWAILCLICGYAFLRGRRDERVVAAVCFVASVASLLSLTQWHARYADVERQLVLVDVATLALFVAVALRSHRFWPLWVAGLQLTTLLGHLFKAMDTDLLPVAYGAALRMWSYPILIILAVGTWRCRRRDDAKPMGPIAAAS